MTIAAERVVLDTNVWIFGLRQQPERPACARLLRSLHRLTVHVLRQVLLELLANLHEAERRDFFRLSQRYPQRLEVSWERVDLARMQTYQQRGCKLGDATVAAHLDVLGVSVLVSENRDFLYEITNLPFRVMRAEEALRELEDSP